MLRRYDKPKTLFQCNYEDPDTRGHAELLGHLDSRDFEPTRDRRPTLQLKNPWNALDHPPSP